MTTAGHNSVAKRSRRPLAQFAARVVTLRSAQHVEICRKTLHSLQTFAQIFQLAQTIARALFAEPSVDATKSKERTCKKQKHGIQFENPDKSLCNPQREKTMPSWADLSQCRTALPQPSHSSLPEVGATRAVELTRELNSCGTKWRRATSDRTQGRDGFGTQKGN